MSEFKAKNAVVKVVLETMPSGLIVVDHQGVVQLINRAGQQYLAEFGQVVVGNKLVECIPDCAGMLNLTDKGQISLASTSKSKSRVIGFTSRSIIQDDQGDEDDQYDDSTEAGTVIVFSDITSERARQVEIEHRRRLADLGSLVASMAHELRNPVTAIGSLARILESEPAVVQNSDALLIVGKIRDEVVRIARLVDDVLGFGRQRELDFDCVDIVQQLALLIEDFEITSSTAGNIQNLFKLEIDPVARDSARTWLVDSDAFRHVMANLIRNSMQAIQEAGGPRDTDRLLIRIGQVDDWLELCVHDTGVGIEAHHLPNLTQPFFTNRRGGTGLGLAVVSRLMRQHGGTLSISSVVGQGTLATVRFPANPEEQLEYERSLEN